MNWTIGESLAGRDTRPVICCECLYADGLISPECGMLVKNRLECNTASCCVMWTASNKCHLDVLKINRHK